MAAMLDHEAVITIAIEAGNAIMEVYGRETTAEVKTKEDESPLTEADLAAVSYTHLRAHET